ncbi:hypothetical protein [Pseudomonas putida]|uniref:Lipoprotein n=1 Tax=Pseudomonas putida TaxID=303 RepID=A0A9X8HK28_PSEPU|nr:hypothetical protein [Pseudomonas putida]ROQ53674.1 hypothetical protein EDF85_1438 [Pseudomonas putida]
MKRLASVVLVALVLAGCGKSNIERAREAVADRLKDPESARFRNERVVGEDHFVCGEVNAKNSAGSYVGFSSYAALRKDDGSYVAFLESEGQTTFKESSCK